MDREQGQQLPAISPLKGSFVQIADNAYEGEFYVARAACFDYARPAGRRHLRRVTWQPDPDQQRGSRSLTRRLRLAAHDADLFATPTSWRSKNRRIFWPEPEDKNLIPGRIKPSSRFSPARAWNSAADGRGSTHESSCRIWPRASIWTVISSELSLSESPSRAPEPQAGVAVRTLGNCRAEENLGIAGNIFVRFRPGLY
jgi:hypothetical protein